MPPALESTRNLKIQPPNRPAKQYCTQRRLLRQGRCLILPTIRHSLLQFSNDVFLLLYVSAEKVPVGFPQITQVPTTKVVEVGHTAVLLCAAVGKPQPVLRWLKNMLPVQIGKNPRYTMLESGKPIYEFYNLPR